MKTDPFASGDDYTGVHLFNPSGSPLPIDQRDARHIASSIEKNDDCRFHLVEIAFVDEDAIIEVNREHLDHDYVTDIITFRYDEDDANQSVEGTLYCCASRIREQAGEFNQSEVDEFKRIIIHGLLHLIGYDDKSDADQQQMRNREDYYLEQVG